MSYPIVTDDVGLGLAEVDGLLARAVPPAPMPALAHDTADVAPVQTVASALAEMAVSAPTRRWAAEADASDAGAEEDHLPAAESDSTPRSVAFATDFRRTVRTIGPIVIADVVGLVAAGLLTQAVLSVVYPDAAHAVGWIGAAVAPLLLIAAYMLGDLYSGVWVHIVVELRQLSIVTTTSLLAAGVGMRWPMPIWCLVAWPAVLALVPMMRAVAHSLCQNRRWWGYPVLVVGSARSADPVVRALLAAPRSGLRPVLVTDPLGELNSSTLPVINDPATLQSIVCTEGIRHAVVSLPDLSHRRLDQALDRYGRYVPHLLVLSEMSTLPTLWSATRNGGRLSGMEVRNGLLLATLQGIKRGIDSMIAATVLLLGMPVLLAVALAVRMASPGPILFSHERIGWHGRLFKAWKFRTMRTDGDVVLREHLANNAAARAEWARDHKLGDDPRVTRIGRFLRKSSLDELPQLWNVLRGEMSLVGPRPIVEAEIWRYGRVFRPYTTVKPGITGLWQVSGRNDIGYDERVQLDEFYIRHWSLWLDVYIFAKTVVALLNRRGAR